MRGYASGFCIFNDVVRRDPGAAGGRCEQGRVRRHRRPPRRRRAGRVLRRRAGADDQPAPGPAHAVPGHRHARPRSAPVPRGHSGERRPAAGHRRRGLAARVQRGRARGRCGRSPPTCWSRSAGATPTTRTRWPTWTCPSTGSAARSRTLHALAHEVSGGRWLAFGGGGYGLVRCVPRTWTHLLAEASGIQVEPGTPIPPEWTAHLRERGVRGELPGSMGEGRTIPCSAGIRAGTVGSTVRSAPRAPPCSRCSGSIRTTPVTDHGGLAGHDPVAADHQQVVPHYEDSEAPEPPAHWEADVVVRGRRQHAPAPDPPVGRGRARRVPRRAVHPHPLPALLLAPTRASRTRDLFRFTHVDHKHRVALVAVLGHADHRRRPLRAAATTPTRPRWRSSSPTRTRAAGSARYCWSIWPPRPARAGSNASTRSSWPRTPR